MIPGAAPRPAAPSCAADGDASRSITVDEIVTALNHALRGCPAVERFVDNGDGTIRDNERGLVWEKKTNDGGIHDVDTAWSWSAADGRVHADGTVFTSFLANLNGTGTGGSCFANSCDWRLPTISELASLAGPGRPEPSLARIFTEPCTAGCIDCSCAATTSWTTQGDDDLTRALAISFIGGAGVVQSLKTTSLTARAVRVDASPQPQCLGDRNRDVNVTVDEIVDAVAAALNGCTPQRFQLTSDGAIHDFDTDLVWQQQVGLDAELHNPSLDIRSDADLVMQWSGRCASTPERCQPDPRTADACALQSPDFASGCAMCGAADACRVEVPIGSDAFTAWSFAIGMNAIGVAGHHDWRLPTVEELRTLVDASAPSPPFTFPVFNAPSCGPGCVDVGDPACGCTGTQGYWTRTWWDTSLVWTVTFATPVNSEQVQEPDRFRHVRLVRGGNP